MLTAPRIARLTLAALLAAVAAPAAADVPPVDESYCNIVCDGPGPDASCAIRIIGGSSLDARRGDIQPLASGDGVEVAGDLAIPTADGAGIPLAQAALVFRFGTPGPAACLFGFDILRGEALLPVPGAGALSQASIEVLSQPMASVGLDLGKNLLPSASPWCQPQLGNDCDCGSFCLDEVPIPRTDDHYLFFDVDAGYAFSIAGFDLQTGPRVAATFVLDPADPFFFLTGSAMGVPGLKTPLNASSGGFGFSWHDEIPFVPLSTYPFGPAIMKTFQGGYAARIKVPILQDDFERVKVLLDGTLVASLDPDRDGDHPFLTPDAFLADPDLALGANGLFSVRFSPFKKGDGKGGKAGKKAKKGDKPGEEKTPSDKDVQKEGKNAKKKGLANTLLSLSFDVGKASAIGRVHPGYTELFLSGTLGGEEGLLPPWMPLPIEAGAGTRMAAYLSTRVENSFVQAEGALGLDTTNLARWAKMEEIGVVLGVDGFLRVDNGGFLIRGGTGSQMHPSVSPSGRADVEAFIAPNGVDTYVTLRGGMAVAGEDLADAELTLSPRGLEIAGTLVLAAHELQMHGSFRGPKGHLEGSTQLEIPYEREDTQARLALLDRILNQSKEVAAAEELLAAAEQALEAERADAEKAGADLAAAIAEVEGLQDQIDAYDAQITQKQLALKAQNDRDCNADYSGCKSCSSCTSRCSCGTYDLVCKADCGVCQTARGICLGEREACRLGNVLTCNADKDSKIIALAGEIGLLETRRAGVALAKDVALGVLEPIAAANELAQATLRTAEATAEAAQAGVDAAQAGLAALRDQLDRLPKITGTVVADVSVAIETGPQGDSKTGRVKGSFEGRKIGSGRIDLEAEPPVACVTVPQKDVGELCGVL